MVIRRLLKCSRRYLAQRKNYLRDERGRPDATSDGLIQKEFSFGFLGFITAAGS